MSVSAADIQNQVNWNNYFALITFVVLYYDFALTFGDEVELFWQRPNRTFVSALFYINRYLALLGNVPILVFRFWPEPFIRLAVCRGVIFYQQFFFSIVQLVISILFITRVYAIYERNKRVLWVLIVADTAMVGNGLLQWFLSKSSIGETETQKLPGHVFTGCLQSYTQQQGQHLVYLWLGVVLVDVLVFTLTLKKIVELNKASSTSLWSVVLRDGVLYFAVITVLNSANILVFAIAREFMNSVLSNLANVIASVMMGRLMLNLRVVYLDLNTTHVTIDSMAPPLSMASTSWSGTSTYADLENV